MCGILCYLNPDSSNKSLYSEAFTQLIPCISDRGPDLQQELKVVTNDDGVLFLFSSVLSLRPPLTTQPIHYQNTNDVLQFNGELYNDDIIGNDTCYFYEKVLHAKSEGNGIISVIQDLRGEYAFTYYDHEAQKLWFGRDNIGKRSLMYSWKPETGEVLISSSVDSNKHESIGMKEVPGGALFNVDLYTKTLNKISWEFYESSSLRFPYEQINSHYDLSQSSESIKKFTIELEEILLKATRKRVEAIPLLSANSSTRLAILFSGGIDCTLLAAFADKVLPKTEKIDLLNVAFDNPRIGGGYNTPDRKLGRRSWKELAQLHRKRYNIPSSDPSRFRFVEVDVSYQETLENRAKVQGLIWPHESVMDLSIAIAFYFASRGKGQLFEHEDSSAFVDYTSHARVLLSGLGADELYGGYTRHTREFVERGSEAFAEELQLDFSRLHVRNLGRDDRACSTWGKELRYPYLDEEVIAWTMKCPLNMKMKAFSSDSSEKEVEGKFILRDIARGLGLNQVAIEKKRAIQFGAKSAKMELGSGKVKGTEVFVHTPIKDQKKPTK